MKDIAQLTTDYFNAFSSKDKDQLKEMYAEDFSLRDWLAEETGREKVLDLNDQFFKAYPTFRLEVLHTYVDDNTSISEIEILLTDHEEGFKRLLVVDVIEFSEEGKMSALRAYFGS
jgi:steroid delta-isomerase